MFKYSKYPITIFFSLTLIIVFTAFGCKEQEEEQDVDSSSENISSAEQVTYNQAELEDAQSEESKKSEENNANDSIEDSSTDKDEENVDSSESVDKDKKLLLEQAEKLAEIYGTYTNKDKNTYKNLKDLKQYSTTELEKWLDEKSKVSIDSNASFYGVTTSALSSVFLEQGNSKSEILVTAKKEEITSTNSTPMVSYRIILMSFEKLEEEWKLSGIYWQD